MQLLLSILVLALVMGLIYWIVSILPLPPTIKQIIQVIIAVICLIYLLGILFGGMPPFPVLRRF